MSLNTLYDYFVTIFSVLSCIWSCIDASKNVPLGSRLSSRKRRDACEDDTSVFSETKHQVWLCADVLRRREGKDVNFTAATF
jgi:hypothetical protein